jgi:MFS family permease
MAITGHKGLAVGLVAGVALVAFEVTAITTALPTISDEFNGDSLFGVATAAYLLANLASLFIAGHLADRYGPRRPYVASLGVFIVGLIVAALATNMVVIVAGRLLQGFGTGGLGPIAYSLVSRAFPSERQPAMYAWLSAGWVVPSLIAPLIAGDVTERVGWQWVFAGLIPLPVLLATSMVRPLGRFGPVPSGTSRLLVAPSIVAAAGAGTVVLGLTLASPLALAVTVAAGAAVAVRPLQRLLPRGVLWAAPGLAAIIAVRLLGTAAFLGVDSFVPLAADRIHGASARVQGFVIIGASVSWTFGQMYMARRSNVAPSRAISAGFMVMVAGVLLSAPVLADSTPLWTTFVGWTVGGFGMGLLFNPSTVAGMSYGEGGDESVVSAQLGLADSLGFSLMAGLGGATVAAADRKVWSLPSALGTNFGAALAFCVLGTFAAKRVHSAMAT